MLIIPLLYKEMILEEATKEAFGYYPSELKLFSHKYILAACELCGKFRVLSKSDYRTLCNSCSQFFGEKKKGKEFTEEHKINISKNHADFGGKNNPNFGKRGKDAAGFKGGQKMANARLHAKRKQLGYILLLPLEDGEEGHHVTDKYVIGIPKEVHEQLGGYERKKHRALILEWLKDNDEKKYNLVLNVLGE